jgi:uncharacterized cupin superfamily protein
MSKIQVEKATPEKLKQLGIEQWGVWECEPSRFDWEYDDQETCYLYEGQVAVQTADGETVRFGAGDIVVFPKGLKCTWDVAQTVRKRYRFG